MSKKINAKQFFKRYPKELHPVAEEKMKCCEIISADWLQKLEKNLKHPIFKLPTDFSKSIEDLVDSDGKLLHNLKRGIDYDLVTRFMFDNLSQFSDPKKNKNPREICCGLGHDPTTGEDIVIFDLVAFNVKMKNNKKNINRNSVPIDLMGERWYASASWTFGEFLRQFCEVMDLDESTHRFYHDSNLEVPYNLSTKISTFFPGSIQRVTAHVLYFGTLGRCESKGFIGLKKRSRRSLSNERSLPNEKRNNDFSSLQMKSRILKNHYSKATVMAYSSMGADCNADTSNVTSSSMDSKEKSENKDEKAKENSVVFEYRFSPSNDLIVPKIEPVGFENLTNSCYMNSVIQCFIRIPPVSSFYYSDDYEQFINTNNKLSSQGAISHEFHNIIADVSTSTSNNKLVHKLTKFRDVFVNQYNMFNSVDQQDAQEFLTCLIDGLHEDINQAFHDEKSRKKVLETLSPNESPWNVSQKLNRSPIYNIFLGMTETKLACQNCNHVETIQEPFLLLPLSIPSTASHSCKLEDCLKRFCQKELINKNEKIQCEKCHKRTNSKKTSRIEKCGEILIIVLKRFEHSPKIPKGNNSSAFKKNDSNVSYPKILDMNPYSSNQIGKYKLIGCIFHYGSLDGGHYTSAALDQIKNTWYVFNDATVTQTIEKNVHNRNAYILFYQKE